MKRFPKCPNCGHDIVGAECRLCHYNMPNYRSSIEYEAQISQFVEQAEKTAKELKAEEKVRKDAEAESAKLIADAQEKATQIICEAQQAATELTEKARVEAEAKWVSIVNEATEIANRLMRLSGAENATDRECA